MSFLFKLTIAILIVFAILFPILISSDNKLSALFWKIPKDFWVFLIIMYWAIITVVFIESSEQARIRRQQYLQQMTNLTLTPCTLIHLKVKTTANLLKPIQIYWIKMVSLWK